MFRKTTLAITLFATFGVTVATAQLTANAGPDKVWCHASYVGYPAPVLGDTPAATGGLPPYQYEWISTDFLPADNYLDSTASANPTMDGFSFYYDSVALVLKVTDAANAVATDTVTVHFSFFAYAMPLDASYVKYEPDTIQLIPTAKSQYYLGGPEAPSTFTWSPATYLLDSAAKYPACRAPVNTVYTLVVTDRFGCQSEPSTHSVFVYPVSVSGVTKQQASVSVYPNPVADRASITVTDEWLGGSFVLYDNIGRVVRQLAIGEGQVTLNRDDLAAGVYYYYVTNSDKQASGKITLR